MIRKVRAGLDAARARGFEYVFGYLHGQVTGASSN